MHRPSSSARTELIRTILEHVRFRQSFEDTPLEEIKIRLHFSKDVYDDVRVFTDAEVEDYKLAGLSHYFCVLQKMKKVLNVDGKALFA